jgi:hypothetical protein
VVAIAVVVAAAAGVAVDTAEGVAAGVAAGAVTVIPLPPVVKVRQARAIRCGSPPTIGTLVVRTTPPLHDAAAAQVDPAATTAPAGRAVTSIAAAPVAASNAAVDAFTVYDGIIEFDHVVNDGGWGAYGDKMTGENSGRSLLTPRHNETTQSGLRLSDEWQGGGRAW